MQLYSYLDVPHSTAQNPYGNTCLPNGKYSTQQTIITWKEYENLQQTSHQVKRRMFDITITITCMKIRKNKFKHTVCV